VFETTKALLIDRVTPLQLPSEQQVSGWARNKRVFISSTMRDLVDARRVAAKTIERMGAQPVMFETLGARTDDSKTGIY